MIELILIIGVWITSALLIHIFARYRQTIDERIRILNRIAHEDNISELLKQFETVSIKQHYLKLLFGGKPLELYKMDFLTDD